MGLDVDAVFIQNDIDKLSNIAFDIPHGKRGNIADDIAEFVEMIEKKYVVDNLIVVEDTIEEDVEDRKVSDTKPHILSSDVSNFKLSDLCFDATNY